MQLLDLYDYAEKHNITVCSFNMPKSECMSVMVDNRCFIGIDPFELKSNYDEKAKLAHEIGHCATCSFYNEFAACDIRAKHERRADKWAIKKLVPKDELIQACKDWCRNNYELAEHFGVPQWFIEKAIAFYFD